MTTLVSLHDGLEDRLIYGQGAPEEAKTTAEICTRFIEWREISETRPQSWIFNTVRLLEFNPLAYKLYHQVISGDVMAITATFSEMCEYGCTSRQAAHKQFTKALDALDMFFPMVADAIRAIRANKLKTIQGVYQARSADEGAIMCEISARIVELMDMPGIRIKSWIRLLNMLFMTSINVAWLYITIQTGDLKVITKSYKAMGDEEARTKQAVQQELEKTIQMMDKACPELSRAIVQLRAITADCSDKE